MAPMPSIPIKIIEQGTTFVKFEFVQPWKQEVDSVWVNYPEETTGDDECSQEDNVATGQAFEYVAQCMHSSPVAVVDVYVADATIMTQGLDDAKVPQCCHPTVPESTPIAHYIFKVYCKSQCE